MTTDSIDVCITFDTTGSMYPCLTQVRRTVGDTIERLFNDIPDLRIAIIAHGDYCDHGRSYVTSIMDFSTNINMIDDFVMGVGMTFGGDTPECYELVLNEARTKLNWGSGRQKVIVMIGDDIPHPVGYQYGKFRVDIDWRNELGLLTEAGIQVYGCHAMPGVRRHSRPFYKEIAKKTGGFYLTLDQFSVITEMIMAICYRQEGEDQLDTFVIEIKKKGKMTRGLQNSISIMKGEEVEDDCFDYTRPAYKTSYRSHSVRESGKEKFAGKTGLIPVPAGRFQFMDVDADQKISTFINDQGVEFKPGRGFYMPHKRTKVQQYKIEGQFADSLYDS